MNKMKKITMFLAMIIAVAAITYSCSKDSNQDTLKASLNNTENLLLKNFQVAKSNDDSLTKYVDISGQSLNPSVFMMDSLYHMSDSLCNEYYLTYCKDMMDGDNMMGGDMMGGDTIHGSGMMMTHFFMGDTNTVNQCYRSLTAMELVHSAHHPVKP
jgi:hypothetical protein